MAVSNNKEIYPRCIMSKNVVVQKYSVIPFLIKKTNKIKTEETYYILTQQYGIWRS